MNISGKGFQEFEMHKKRKAFPEYSLQESILRFQ